MENFFGLRKKGTTVSREIMGGVTTFFAMSYILAVNPAILSDAGLPYYGSYIATIFAAFIGTMLMGVYANIPYAQAPGMGLNAFFTYTIVIAGGFTAYEGLAIIFVSGLINLLLTVTSFRKQLLEAIPASLQHAISAGIGLFVAYLGFLNIGMVEFGAVPSLAALNSKMLLLALFGIAFTLILMLKEVPGAILLGLVVTTLVGIPLGVVNPLQAEAVPSFGQIFGEFTSVFGKALGSEGLGSLVRNHNILEVVPFMFAAALTDTFDTIGTLIGTGRRSGIFTESAEDSMVHGSGISSNLEKGLVADIIATVAGTIMGTSTVTTFVESSAGIAAGARTGLASVVTAFLFLASILLAPIIGLVPAAATAPALIIVGILMSASFADIAWENFDEAIPAFTTIIITTLTYSISNGIAFGFMTYILVKVVKGHAKEIHPILWLSTLLFIVNFIFIAIG